jgi:hypothetical protein
MAAEIRFFCRFLFWRFSRFFFFFFFHFPQRLWLTITDVAKQPSVLIV